MEVRLVEESYCCHTNRLQKVYVIVVVNLVLTRTDLFNFLSINTPRLLSKNESVPFCLNPFLIHLFSHMHVPVSGPHPLLPYTITYFPFSFPFSTSRSPSQRCLVWYLIKYFLIYRWHWNWLDMQWQEKACVWTLWSYRVMGSDLCAADSWADDCSSLLMNTRLVIFANFQHNYRVISESFSCHCHFYQTDFTELLCLLLLVCVEIPLRFIFCFKSHSRRECH